ncbi:alpha/beta fold hydrolase [Geminocystis sp. NIES-3709]|uniref:alpha/beta fold hydrolase n=1 Tax=Geminocystis sp. NIES-3709 TaxID=1617448 RepID=UPI0005FC4820|nr:alpha/beta fold hydrolase [Geminocystis sp. NIES-3709]BAQ66309.1 alkaline phosphatase [Geminocystis sp. NIES-3709]
MTKLTQALTEAQNLLLNASLNPELPTILTTAFGENYNPTEAHNIFSRWRNQDFSNLPQIQILPSTILNNAQGAYSATSNTIYLSSTLLEQQSFLAIRNVLLEEIGHFIDAQINSIDTPGDEGAIFSALVQGKTLTEDELSKLRAEEDTAIIYIDGEAIEIEQSINVIGQWGEEQAGAFSTVKVIGNYAYIANNGLLILDISDPNQPIVISNTGTTSSVFDVEVVGDRAFVTNYGYDGGLVILNIANPSAPTILGSYNTGYVLDVEVLGDLAFVIDRDALVILNIADPSPPTRLGSYFGRAHDVEVVGDRAFVAGRDGLVILDIANPSAPTILGSYDTGYAFLDVKVVDDQAFVATGYGDLVILDIANPSAPTILGSYNTPGYAMDVEVVGDRAFVTNYTYDGGLVILDIANPSAPTPLGSYSGYSGNAYDVDVVGDRAFLSGSGGLVILDVSDYLTPINIETSFTVTGGDPNSPNHEKIEDPFFRDANFKIVSTSDEQLKKSYPAGKNVWLVFHGWNGNFGQFIELGQTIARAKPNDIVLALDWTEIAHTANKGNDTVALRLGENFIAASWIRPLAEQIQETLKNWGLTDATKLNLVGHSLGTLVSSELASLYKEENPDPNSMVKSITALDPPSEVNKINFPDFLGYDLDFDNDGYNDENDRPKPFKDVAQFSRAFVGDPSIAGNEEFASWADESFLVNFNQLTDGGGAHGWVVDVFQSLIDPSKHDFKFVNNLFTLDD